MLAVKEIPTNDYVTKSNLPFCDYITNPYVGCTHGCKYCYITGNSPTRAAAKSTCRCITASESKFAALWG